jgi:hypothetical protein
MTDASRIRGFLLQSPKPQLVRITTNDGEPHELKPGRSYAKTADTIAALDVDLIECLDDAGKLLRALRMSSPDALRSDAAAMPKGLEADPQAMMLTHFANLIHRAYEHSTEIAFSKMVELVERIGDRSEAIEARLERAEAAHRRAVDQQIDDAFERAEETAEKAKEGSGDLLQNLAGAFLNGQMQSAAKPAAARAANGAGKGNG